MKRIAICDDSKLQRQLLVETLKEYYRRNHEQLFLIEYDSGESLVLDVEEEECEVDLIFLDIYMPGMNGMDTAKKLRELKCTTEIVFLTATDDYALAGYDVQASGYLLKPIDMNKLTTLLRNIFWGEYRKRIEIKYGKKYRYPYISDIMYIESSNHKAILYFADGNQLETMEKLSTLKERLDDDHFLQCHQSYLVNMNYIADIRRNVVLDNGKEIPISVRRKKETIETYHQFFVEIIE